MTIHCYFCYYMTITMFCKPNKTLNHHYGNNTLLYLWTHLTVITLSREGLLRTGGKDLGHSITFPPVRVATCWSEMWNTGKKECHIESHDKSTGNTLGIFSHVLDENIHVFHHHSKNYDSITWLNLLTLCCLQNMQNTLTHSLPCLLFLVHQSYF